MAPGHSLCLLRTQPCPLPGLGHLSTSHIKLTIYNMGVEKAGWRQVFCPGSSHTWPQDGMNALVISEPLYMPCGIPSIDERGN